MAIRTQIRFTGSAIAIFILAQVPNLASADDKGKGEKKKRDPAAVFKKLDKDSDGKLSLEEFVGKRKDKAKTKAEARFKKLDKDGDSAVSLEEFKSGGKKKKN